MGGFSRKTENIPMTYRQVCVLSMLSCTYANETVNLSKEGFCWARLSLFLENNPQDSRTLADAYPGTARERG